MNFKDFCYRFIEEHGAMTIIPNLADWVAENTLDEIAQEYMLGDAERLVETIKTAKIVNTD